MFFSALFINLIIIIIDYTKLIVLCLNEFFLSKSSIKMYNKYFFTYELMFVCSNRLIKLIISLPHSVSKCTQFWLAIYCSLTFFITTSICRFFFVHARFLYSTYKQSLFFFSEKVWRVCWGSDRGNNYGKCAEELRKTIRHLFKFTIRKSHIFFEANFFLPLADKKVIRKCVKTKKTKKKRSIKHLLLTHFFHLAQRKIYVKSTICAIQGIACGG